MLSLQGTSIQLTKGTFPYKKRCTPNLYPVSVQSPSGSLQRICRNYPGLGVKCTQAVSAEQASTSVADDVNILGIDIGGQTVKAAVVDVSSGKIISQKLVVVTPNPATPEAVAVALKQIVDHFNWTGYVGVGFPAVVRNGVVCTAANIDRSWIGTQVEELFYKHLGLKTKVVNDADAAGYAEIEFGAASGEETSGIVMMITFGTGIGTAMFVNGILVPNLELGHVELNGFEAEKEAAGILVEHRGLTWDEWALKVQDYLDYLERLLWPTLFVIGGGVTNAHDKWLPKVKLPNNTPIKVATMLNDAGIVGAALAVKEVSK